MRKKKYSTNKTNFNIVICGVGGQGLITLLRILAEASLLEGKEVRTSELHGLSQRGGSVETHMRFGKKIFSPLIASGQADLILGLEMNEVLLRAHFANPNTIFLVNQYYFSFPKALPEKKVMEILKKLKNLYLVPATKICQEKLGTEVVSGIYLLSFGVFKNLIPLKPTSLLKAIKKIVPEPYFEINKKTFELAKFNAV
jgi:indolepyruvate ferredoxin oxidoreductase beta subunit